MQNDEGTIVDLYVPRRCTATNDLITPKDHASVQINVAKTDDNGRMTGEVETIAFSGMIRSQGEADAALYRIVKERGIKLDE